METPRDKLITAKSKGGTVKGIVHWSSDFGPRKTNAFLLAQKFVDSEVLRHSDPLTPRMNGDLIKAGARTTRIGEGLVQYADPKARYLYYGKVMVGRAPKTVTDKPLVYDGAPTRGAFWFERMKSTVYKGLHRVTV